MKDKYPPRNEWLAIRARIMERARNRCEFCGVPHHALIVRAAGKDYRQVDGSEADAATLDGEKVVKVILTTAHLDQDPTNNDDSNLRALCQRCHNLHDAPHRKKNAARTIERKKHGQTSPIDFPESEATNG